jgi:hypothetical protein
MNHEAVFVAVQNRLTRTCLAIQWLILAVLVVLLVVFRNFGRVAYFVRDSDSTTLEAFLNGSLPETG